MFEWIRKIVNDNKAKKLINAINNQDLVIFRKMLMAGADVNYVTADGATALSLAVEKGAAEIVLPLLEHGADVNYVTANGATALLLAVEKDAVEIVKQLLEYDADVNYHHYRFSSNNSPLILASKNSNPVIVELLLANGADVNYYNQKANTALLWAVDNNCLPVVKLLLTKTDIDINHSNQNSSNAMLIAVAKGYNEIVELLVASGANINYKSESGTTALMMAAEGGHLEVVKTLVVHGARINYQNQNGFTALMMAAKNGHLEVVKFLLAQDAKVNENNWFNATALLLAAENQHSEIVELLVAHGADVNCVNQRGNSALMWCVQYSLPAVKALLAHGAEINHHNEEEITALISAVVANDSSIVEFLLAHGANINHEDKNGNTALIWATTRNYPEIINLLLINGANIYHQNKKGKMALDSAPFFGANSTKNILKQFLKVEKWMEPILKTEKLYQEIVLIMNNNDSLLQEQLIINLLSNYGNHIKNLTTKLDEDMRIFLQNKLTNDLKFEEENYSLLELAVFFEMDKLIKFLVDEWVIPVNLRDKAWERSIFSAAKPQSTLKIKNKNQLTPKNKEFLKCIAAGLENKEKFPLAKKQIDVNNFEKKSDTIKFYENDINEIAIDVCNTIDEIAIDCLEYFDYEVDSTSLEKNLPLSDKVTTVVIENIEDCTGMTEYYNRQSSNKVEDKLEQSPIMQKHKNIKIKDQAVTSSQFENSNTVVTKLLIAENVNASLSSSEQKQAKDWTKLTIDKEISCLVASESLSSESLAWKQILPQTNDNSNYRQYKNKKTILTIK